MAVLLSLFEKLHLRENLSKEGKQMAATVGWPLLWAVRLTIDAQLETNLSLKVGRRAEVRKGRAVIHYSASFRSGRQFWKTRIISWRP